MIGRSFPLYPGKHAFPAVTDPSEHTAYVQTQKADATLTDLAGVVLLYQRTALRDAYAHYTVRPLEGWVRGHLGIIQLNDRSVGICGGFGPGAPAAGLILEQLLALGAQSVITVGTAAALQPDLRAGEIVVCTRALRDEGLSHHYLTPSRYVRPSIALSSALLDTLATQGVRARAGAAWSTDAPYRETEQEVAQYGAEGVLVADMEAAGVLAVAEHRGADAAAAFAVADSLVDRRPRHDAPHVRTALGSVLQAALAALRTAT
ncbi:nucleoside phosphorylase [Streptomyces syringium]|uniref:nucleoside phosphorylase n=1 Tax=Streptomyces syringium TaxID=76729 RepID=UPI0034545470